MSTPKAIDAALGNHRPQSNDRLSAHVSHKHHNRGHFCGLSKMPPLSSCMYRNSTSAAFISSLPWSSRYLFRSGKLPLSCRRSRPTLLIWRKGETGVLWTAPRHSWYLPVLSPAHRTSRFNTVALVDFDAGDPNAMPQSHSLTPDELLRETHRFVEKHPHDKSSLHLARRRRLNAFIALFGGVVCLPFYGHVLAELVIPRGTVQMQIVITGAYSQCSTCENQQKQ